jgi:RNA polymerase sigma factor (sigma-70 family)
MPINQLRRVIQSLRRSALSHQGADLTDGQLLENYVRSGEEAAFAALVNRHGPMVWGVCRRVLGSHQDAEDAFQATFLVLVRRAASVSPREMVANWLHGVAHRTALKARATTARRQAREKQVPVLPEPAAQQQDPWNDLQPLLDQELSRLPAKYRAVLLLCDLDGRTRKETAQQLNVPEGTVASRLATARTMLAKRLARHDLALSGAALAALLSQQASASVPASVVSATVQGARLFAAGEVVAVGVLSARAVALARAMLQTLLLTRLKIATGMVVLVALLGTSAAALRQREGEAPAEPAFPVRLEPRPPDQPVAEKKESDKANVEENGFWPQWRGPNRDGVVQSVTVPASWPRTLQEEWKVTVGEGVASPVVVGGNVYVFTRQKEDEVVLCLDLVGGKEVWRSEAYPAPYQWCPEERNFSKGPRATPTVAGGRVYTVGMSGVLSCLDAGTGTLLWRKNCKANAAPARPPSAHDYGGSSPLVADGLCIVHVGDGKNGGLTAFDALSGEQRWCYGEGYSPMSGSPILADLAGERQVVTYSSSNAAGVSAATGNKLWRVGADGVGQPHTTPVRYKELLILADILQPLRAIRLDRNDQGITVRDVWKSQGLPLGYSSPVLAGDLVFGMSSRKNGCFFCLDASSGETRWESAGRQGDYVSILNAGSVLLFLTEKGRLIVVKPSATAYEPIVEYHVSDADTHAHPVFLGERLLIKDADTLRSLRISDK